MRAVGALVVAAVTGALLVAPGASGSAAAGEPGCDAMPYVAHRGVTSGGVTENTLGAMRQAAALGAGSEIDLRTTADGKIVLMHDVRLARTTNGDGAVAKWTSRQLRRLRTDDGQRIPYLRGALALVRDDPRTSVVLDLKVITPEGQRRIADLIAEFGIADRVSAISFKDELIAAFRAANPGLPTFRIFQVLPSPDLAASLGGVNVWADLVTDEWLEEMAATDVPFNLRVTQDVTAWDLAVRAGSSWIMTDDVRAWRAYCPAP